jgi:phosphoglucan, water dikinase
MEEANRIRIGNQSAFSASDVMEPFRYALDNGFDAFEWFPDKRESGEGWEASDLSPEVRDFIRRSSLDRDIRLSVHGPWQLNLLNPHSREPFLENIRFAQDIGASVFNVHFYLEDGIAPFAEAVLPLLDRLASAGIRLAIENTTVTGPLDFNELFRLLAWLVSPEQFHRVGMCLDIGHANLCSATRNDYLKFVDLLDSAVAINHVHVHENYGDSDSHLPLFCGPAGRDAAGIRGLAKRLRSRGFSGCIILEQWPQPPHLLIEARDRLGQILFDGTADGKPSGEADPPAYALPADDFAACIVSADRERRSWRRKLEWIQELVTDNTFELTADRLVYLAIYLRFIGRGDIACEEDGGHYRPSHHARSARVIHDRLAASATTENTFVLRRIYPWLPSFKSAFTAVEPLTRIRDIAHRNDIPRELKQEIKTTLQNKLHRCAGPEDLVTSTRLLRRITDPNADYSLGFVEEFKRFHEELEELFNARSLDRQLADLMEKGDNRNVALIRRFLDAKERAAAPAELVGLMEVTASLRERLREMLDGMSGSDAQEIEFVDIKLEDYAFVVLSRLNNHWEAAKENHADADESGALLSRRREQGQGKDPFEGEDVLDSLTLRGLVASIANLRLGGFDARECEAVESELNAMLVEWSVRDRDALLRLKATLDRWSRVADGYCGKIIEWFPSRVEKLGRALGVAEHARKVFAESDIRNHLVFQLSRLVSLLLYKVRMLANLSPWDVIVPGMASGRTTVLSRLDDLALTPHEPMLVLLEMAEGDEEIPAGVAGMIVGRPVPHLSHLAVRARQASVVFVVCEDADRFAELKELDGDWLNLDGSPGGVKLEVARGVMKESTPVQREESKACGGTAFQETGLHVPDVLLDFERPLLALDQVTRDRGGGKAFGARRLLELSGMDGAGFHTVSGLVIPFGVMEASLRSSPSLHAEYERLAGTIDDLPPDEIESALSKLRHIIDELTIGPAIPEGVTGFFGRDQRLMVRSSTNCEDLEEFAGAGLYESVANVGPLDVGASVRRVWASLWTKRAAASRKALGVPNAKAHMAVLVQRMLVPEYSFILHTVNPINGDAGEVYMELAVGLGETLASGETAGTPYRMAYNKCSREVKTLAYASFSTALVLGPPGGETARKIVDYSKVKLTTNQTFRIRMAAQLGEVGVFVEKKMGLPQDIEGAFLEDKIYLVQARSQQGIG